MKDATPSRGVSIVPVNEPRGEGNGWDCCMLDKATCFEIWVDDEMVDYADSLHQAQSIADKLREEIKEGEQ